jgi:hypothetical protein
VEIFLAARQVSEVAELRAKWPIEFSGQQHLGQPKRDL